MQDLQFFIDMLTKGRGIHIAVLDLDGILSTEQTSLVFKSTIHSKDFCHIAKSTERGYARCVHCKGLANARAISSREGFWGYCPWGLCEAALPVVRRGTVAAIIYVGNFIVDECESRARLERACRLLGREAEPLAERLGECERLCDPREALRLAELVRDHLLALADRGGAPVSELNWLTRKLKQYADDLYCTDVKLRDLAVRYHKSEKYMGRIFLREMGVSFREYCNRLRLARAERMLVDGDEKIIDIALECGFNNVSYFNRQFKKAHGITPGEWRSLSK